MVRVNNDFNINKYISANLDLNFSRSKALSPNSNPMGAGGRNIPPIYAATWTNGLWGDVKDGENMLAKLQMAALLPTGEPILAVNSVLT